MKRCIFLLFILLSVAIGNVYADETGKNVLNFRKINKEHKTYFCAVGISANSLGDVAIGFSDDYINVYDKHGNFKYSFAFKVDGSYLFEFDNQNNIIIFTARDGMRYYFSADAKLIRTEKISDPVERERYYENHSNKRNLDVDGISYSMRQAFGYMKFIKTDADGNELVIYETGSQYIFKILIALIILALVALVICGLIKTISTEMKKYMET